MTNATKKIAVIAIVLAGVAAFGARDAARADTASVGIATRMPGPVSTTYRRGERARRDEECRVCHADVARTHDASLHAHAFDDPSFAKGYAIEPQANCRACHAPETAAVATAEPDAFARARGVACVTCHLPDERGGVLADAKSTGKAGESSTRASVRAGGTRMNPPHAVTRVENFGTRACAACHEFAFSGAEHDGPPGLMQKTMREHASAPATLRDRTCASCHMQRGGDHDRAAHGFGISRDATLLARAVDVRAERGADGVARFFLTAKGMGHAFPTGDLFRRLVLRARTPRGTFERVFARSFRTQQNEAGKTVRFETSDTRLRPDETIEAPMGTSPMKWELAYQRVTGVGQSPPFQVDVEEEIILARGEL